jgi:mannitol operon transcriptional antiterminator
MTLRRKNIQLLLSINNNPLTVKELSAKFDNSERNIRYMLENLDHYMLKLLDKNIEKENKKYFTLLSDMEINFFLENVYEKFYFLDNRERVEYIMLLFLFIEDITLSAIEQKLSITRATLKKDMEMLADEFKKSELFFYRNKNRIYVGGNEKKLRHLKMKKIRKYFFLQNNKIRNRVKEQALYYLDKSFILEQIREEDMPLIEKKVDKIQEDFQCVFSQEFKEILCFYLAVTLERIHKKEYIMRKDNYQILVCTEEYEIVKNTLKDVIPVSLNYEFAHLTEYFISGKNNLDSCEFRENIELFTMNLLDYISKKFNVDVRDDVYLQNMIISYLIPAIYRLKNNFNIGSVDNKNDFFYTIEEFCKNEDYLAEKLTDVEIAYIAKLVERKIRIEKNKIISLREMMEIINESCEIKDNDLLINSIIKAYGDIVKNDL